MNTFKLFLKESATSVQAKRMGLDYFGFGKYGKDGVVKFTVKNNQLIPFNGKEPTAPVRKNSITKIEGQRVFDGSPIPNKTKISKQTLGAIGEQIAIAYLKQFGIKDAKPLNVKTTNFPVDLIGDHMCVESKAGNVANSKAAQQWRATIGQPGKKETEWLKIASKEEKREWNKKKAKAIMDRKHKVLYDMSKKYGTTIKAKTITTIINPDTRMADIFVFEGFHSRISWTSKDAQEAYAGTYRF